MPELGQAADEYAIGDEDFTSMKNLIEMLKARERV